MTPEQVRALDALRKLWPEKAAEIERVLSAAGPEVAAKMKINIGIHYTLKKFDGEYSPEKDPVEVIEGRDSIG